MSRDINPFGLRMPDTLKAEVEKLAKKNHRSMNAEIIAMIESCIEGSKLDATGLKKLMREAIREEFSKTK